MRNKKLRIAIFVLVFFFVAILSFSQSRETGAIKGKVVDQDGKPIPGVSVILTSSALVQGKITTITDDNGRFRFVALTPGEYSVEASLEGFKPIKRTGLRLHIGMTLTVDLKLTIGNFKETIVVKAKPPLVDVKDSSTASTNLSKELLQNIPNSQFVTNIVNLAPGVSNNSAFGGAASSGISYQVDGVDVSDPEGGSAWVFLDYNIVEEAKVMGVGLPAEYGGFTGAIMNTVTKSGGNNFQGHFEALYQSDSWNSSNSDDPNLKPAKQGYMDFSLHLGGPIVKDKVWFFLGLQYYRTKNYPAGFPDPIDYKQPRGFIKLTFQPNRDNRVQLFFEYDVYNGINRGANALTKPEATVRQTSPDKVWNLSYLHIFSDKTFMEAKLSGYVGYYYLEPEEGRDISGHRDLVTGWNTVNAGYHYLADRSHYQVNASVSHHAEDFIKGSHDFKFGVEVEKNWVRNRYGYNGKNSIVYADSNGQPYMAYGYEGYDTDVKTTRASFYAQDSWSISDNLTINPGVRFNMYRGYLTHLNKTVYKPNGIAPRVGITYDVFGDHTTAIKAHYGKFYEGIFTSYFSNLDPQHSDFIIYLVPQYGTLNEILRFPYENSYSIDDNIKHPYMNQYTVGIEREIMRDVSISLTYIHRENKDLIDSVNTTGLFVEKTITDPDNGQKYDVWNQTNPGTDKYIITNPKKAQYPIVQFTPQRKYDGMEFVINKRFSNNWQLLASYVYGKATGNYDNNMASNIGQSGMFKDPNNQINSEGHLTNDPTHMLKLQGTVILPLDINFSFYFSYITGNTYTRYVRVKLNQGNRNIFTEPRGSRRLPDQKNLDLKLEKIFRFGDKTRVGVGLDIFNVFNTGVATGVRAQAGSSFGTILGLTNPRGFRAGIRLFF
jgi:hypothetical protein